MMTALKNLAKRAFYNTLNVCTCGRGVPRLICGEQVRLPAQWCRWYGSNYEPHTFRFLRSRCARGQTAFDIGAHLGLFTVVMARQVGPQGRVFSFEPTPSTRRVLEETVRLNQCDETVTVCGEAVSDRSGVAIFYDTGACVSNANSLVHTERSQSSINVPVIRLDDFVDEHGLQVHCLKIDVEGAELNVLRGAERSFRVHRPAAALSLHPAALEAAGQSLSEIWNLLQDYSVEVRLLEDYRSTQANSGPMAHETFCKQTDLFDVALLPI